jgi:ubiquinol-cytochrome c reductase iron-sulfur subunit
VTDPAIEPAADPRAERRSERHAATGFAVSALASIGLAVLYWRGGQPQLEGVLLAVAFGSMGYGFVIWANRLLPQGPFEEQRHELVAGPGEWQAIESDIGRGGEVGRRTLLLRALAAAAGALGVAMLFPIRSLGPRPGRSLLRTSWRRGAALVTEDGRPVLAADVPLDGLVTVFPEGHAGSADSQAVLMRVGPGLNVPVSGRETWAPDGLIAYSKVCTHAGCPVGLYQADTHQLLCPCHQSSFDVLHGAKPVFGPAAWPLPQLPLGVDAAGVVRARGDFSEPVGPGYWRER